MKSYLLISLLFLGFTCSNPDNKRNEEGNFSKKKLVEKKDTLVYSCDYLGQIPPGKTSKLFSPNFISTTKEHSALMITPNGKEMWFGRLLPSKIWYLKNENGKWSNIIKAPFDNDYSYLYPFLSPDGNRIFFTSDRPVDHASKSLPRSDVDLWYIVRQNETWSEPIHMGDTINFGNRHATGSISSSGNLYYSVRTGKLYNYTTKSYFAKFSNGKYETPIIISELDSFQPQGPPFVAPDESYLIFSSFRGGMGMSDLFICFKTSSGTWTNPINLGKQINSVAKDEYPYITPDGKYLFFNSNRISKINNSKIPNGPGNIYWVKADFIEQLNQVNEIYR